MFKTRIDLICRAAVPRRAGSSVTGASAHLAQPGFVLFPRKHLDLFSGSTVRAPRTAERFGVRAYRRTVSVHGPGQCCRISSEVCLAPRYAADTVRIGEAPTGNEMACIRNTTHWHRTGARRLSPTTSRTSPPGRIQIHVFEGRSIAVAPEAVVDDPDRSSRRRVGSGDTISSEHRCCSRRHCHFRRRGDRQVGARGGRRDRRSER